MTKRPKGKRVEFSLPGDHPFFSEIEVGQRAEWLRRAIEDKLSSDSGLMQDVFLKLNTIDEKVNKILKEGVSMEKSNEYLLETNSELDISALADF